MECACQENKLQSQFNVFSTGSTKSHHRVEYKRMGGGIVSFASNLEELDTLLIFLLPLQ